MLAESNLDTKKIRALSSFRWVMVLLLIIPALTVQSAPSSPGATIVVNTTLDEYGTGLNCSLREAIQSTQIGSDFGGCTGTGAYGSAFDADIITLPAGTYTLSIPPGDFGNANGDLNITGPLVINGAGEKTTIIQAGTTSPVGGNTCVNCVDRVLYISGPFANVEINGVTIRYGKTPDGVDGVSDATCNSDSGGGIYLDSGVLTLNDSHVSFNRTGDAGDGCTFILPGNGSSGKGGGIFNSQGILILNSTTVRANETGKGGDGTEGEDGYPSGSGGGIYLSYYGVITLTDSLVSVNSTGRGGFGGDAVNADAGSGANGGDGGGIYSKGALTVINSTVLANTTGSGGLSGDVISGNGDGGDGADGGIGAGIYSTSSTAILEIDGSIVRDNETGLPSRGGTGSGTGINGANGVRGRAGGIYASDNSFGILQDSTISANRGYHSGGIYIIDGATLEINACTVSNNIAEVNGGGILNATDGILKVYNSTISGNGAYSTGGGIYNNHGEVATLNNVTITGNTADLDNNGVGDGGGFYSNGTITMTNSIVAMNFDKGNEVPDLCGTVISGDYNLLGIGDVAWCTFVAQPNDQVGTFASPINPLLAILYDNGGPTLTHSLKPGSPALDQIPNGINGCAAGSFDQRAFLRFPPCDIGAYEVDQSEHIYVPMLSRD